MLKSACIGVVGGEPQCVRDVDRWQLARCWSAVLRLVLGYDQTIQSWEGFSW